MQALTAARTNHQRIIQLKTEATRSFILLGKELKTNKEQRYFETLGSPTFEEYIESPSLGFARSSVYSLIAIYQTFVETLGYSINELSAIDHTKLDRLLPLVNVHPGGHQQWLEKARTLPRRLLESQVKLALETNHTRKPKPATPPLPADWLNTIHCGDALELLQQLPDKSIDCCITSPPYWALRDFGVEGQLGLEPTFHDFIEHVCDVFDEVRRVLKYRKVDGRGCS